MLASEITQRVPMHSQAIQEPAENTGRYTISFPSIARVVRRLAIPIFFTLALSSIPGAEAGPMAYAACTTLCLGFATPIFAPLCITGCLPALAAPTP